MGNLQRLVILGVTLLSVYLLLTYVTDSDVDEIALKIREKEWSASLLTERIQKIYYGNNPQLLYSGLKGAVKLLSEEQAAELVRVGQDLKNKIDELEHQLDISTNNVDELRNSTKKYVRNATHNADFWEQQLARKGLKSNAEEYIEALDKHINILEKYLEASQQLEEMIEGIIGTKIR